MPVNQPLRYKISSWRQLPECTSNNDRNLRITITDFVGNYYLTGMRISVVHPEFGVLFSEVLDARGNCITTIDGKDTSDLVFELDKEHILQELRKYGFYIKFEQRENLPEDMLEYLNTLRGLKFDKLRVLNVYTDQVDGTREYKWYVVGFQSRMHKYWLTNTYQASKDEFTKALLAGTAMNISEMCSAKGANWSWLDYVANIDDILRENMEAKAGHGK